MVEIVVSMILLGNYKLVLVIGFEYMLFIFDWEDCLIVILFGDVVGVVIIEVSDNLKDNVYFWNGFRGDDMGILWIDLKVKMVGCEVYKFVVDIMFKVIYKVFEKVGFIIDDIDYIIFY